MKDNDHQEIFEHPVRGQRRESHHHEESEHRRRSDRGERGEHVERSHHHASWRSSDENGSRSGQRQARVERGMLRYLLLDALHHGPKHGYEIIKWLEEQTYDRYTPSAGTVYPTLQLLEDQGLILAERTDEKSIYRLTETGEADLQTHTAFTQEFWQRYGQPIPPPATLLSTEFVYEELQDLQRAVETATRLLTQQNDQQNLLSLRHVLERSKNEIRDLLINNTAPQPMSPGTHDAPVDARKLEEAITHLFVSEDEALRQTLLRANEHGLPAIQISALQGKLLQLLALACQARKILEIGSLAGYSGIWLARALPRDGRLITLEIDPAHADIVRESFRQAQVDDQAEVRVGPAIETLPSLKDEGPFDLIFIDADKDSYPQYLAWAIQLARPGSIIVADNTVRDGNGLRIQETAEPRMTGIRSYNGIASSNLALCSVALPINTGMTISVVLNQAAQA